MPLLGSLANVCIEDKIPDLTKNVPVKEKANVNIESRMVQLWKWFLFSRTTKE